MKKLLTVFGVAGFALASLAAVNDTLISFSTPGPDKYADGATVQDGECYALVWSADGVFEGVDVNGAPLDANDRVVLVAPVAKDGKCPDLIYQVDAAVAAQLASGQYAVYLLDTRRAGASGDTVVGLEDGKLAFVRSVASASASGAPAASGTPTTIAAADAVGGASATVFAEVASTTVVASTLQLVSNPKPIDHTVTEAGSDGDLIMIPSDDGTMDTYTYKTDKSGWCQYESTSVTVGSRTLNVKDFVVKTVKIPGGRGVWYASQGSTVPTFNW